MYDKKSEYKSQTVVKNIEISKDTFKAEEKGYNFDINLYYVFCVIQETK